MPSTNKTSILKLNYWAETDKPTRSDFVEDNRNIDFYLGGHVINDSLHLSASERSWLEEPYSFKVIQGNDTAERIVTLDCAPRLVIYFAFDCSPVEMSSGTPVINHGIAVSGKGGSRGCEISGETLVITHGTINGIKYNLNSSSNQYGIVMFK